MTVKQIFICILQNHDSLILLQWDISQGTVGALFLPLTQNNAMVIAMQIIKFR